MTQNGLATSIVTVTEGVPTDVVCSATGARPAVVINWYDQRVNVGNESKITEGFSQINSTNQSNNKTFDTVPRFK